MASESNYHQTGGIRLTHQDLAANIWTNPEETAGTTGVDDDLNGYIDDIYGVNVVSGAPNPVDPSDDNGHGTHVAGIVGAVGNNGAGVVGVAWSVKLMAVKAANASNKIFEHEALDAINYAIGKRVQIINASWGGFEYNVALRDAIGKVRNRGIIFVASAGGQFSQADNDDLSSSPNYPSSFDIDNIVAVAATAKNDTRHTRVLVLSQSIWPPLGVMCRRICSRKQMRFILHGTVRTPHIAGYTGLPWRPRTFPAPWR